MSGTRPAIVVHDLVKRYGDHTAVRDLSFTVETGEVFGLLGPNGAGKTTTVEILEGYRRPDGGSVEVLGLDPAAEGTDLRARIGVMLQEGGLYPGLRPLEMLELFAAYYPDPDDPERLLDVVGLTDRNATTARRLSGGESQRLSLALALVGRPELVFLDEPTAGMDPHARADTWDIICELRASGATVVLTTHGMDEAEQLCDRLAIVDHGRLVALGTPDDITTGGGPPEVRFSAAPALDTAALARHVGLGADRVAEERPGEYVLRTAATPALIAGLAAWLAERDVTLTGLRSGRRSLEEVFLRLTRTGRPAVVPGDLGVDAP
ncbi:MAG: ABC transporter ATP-binding protein [Acidimicrobiia bacterium]